MMVTDLKYKKVPAGSTDDSGGFVPAVGAKFGFSRIRLSAGGDQQPVAVIWDYGGAQEKIFSATTRDVDYHFDPYANAELQFVGDGSRALKIILENTGLSQSSLIGGQVDLVEIK